MLASWPLCSGPAARHLGATATSALDGTVTFVPVSISGVATNLVALAATGNSGPLTIAIEQHP